MAQDRTEPLESLRVDTWLWAARFYKTRSQATEAVQGGHVEVNGSRAKPSKAVKPGDRIEVTLTSTKVALDVTGLARRRGSAEVAATLFEETTASRLAREALLAERKLAAAPRPESGGRPTKRDRRRLDATRGRG